jgi:hypothetical protein
MHRAAEQRYELAAFHPGPYHITLAAAMRKSAAGGAAARGHCWLLLHTVMDPLWHRIEAVISVSATTGRPCSVQIRPVASWRDKRR